MSEKRRVKGGMRERLGSLSAALTGFVRNPNPFNDPYGCTVSVVLVVIAAVVILGGMYLTGVIDYDFTQTPAERAASEEGASTGDAGPAASQESAAPSGPVAENPTAVGQAVDAIARPAIEEVYGDAQLQSAPSVEAPIVSLQYGIPTNPAEGDGEKLRTALVDRGARVDPANSEMDYHAGEEFMVLIDTGNPAYKSIRVSVSPEFKTVYVNADRSD